jgi:hypothetical protein
LHFPSLCDASSAHALQDANACREINLITLYCCC